MTLIRNRAWFFIVVFAALMIGVLVLERTVVRGQADRWYPSRWGANDQRGAANRITPAKILEAKSLITRGTIYQVGRLYEAGMPMFGTRHYLSLIHISEPTRLLSISYAVFCLKKKKKHK